MQGVVATGGELAVHVHQVPHTRDLGGQDDAIVRKPTLLGQLGGADGALHHGIHGDVARVARLGRLGVLVHQLGEQLLVERSPVHPDTHRLAVGDGHFHDLAEVGVVVLGAHVAGVDTVLGERLRARRILGEQQVPVVVEVANDGDVHLGHDRRDGGRRSVVIDGDPHQLRARLGQGPNLRRGLVAPLPYYGDDSGDGDGSDDPVARRWIVTAVRRPGALSSVMVPPQLSTKRRAIARPSPEPLDVVENAGSNTRGRASGGMPRPLSVTVRRRPSAATRTTTSWASAWRAVSSRVTRTSFTSWRRPSTDAPLPSASKRTAAPPAPPPRPYSCTVSRPTATRLTASTGG